MLKIFSRPLSNCVRIVPIIMSTTILTACLTTASMRSETEYMPHETRHETARAPQPVYTTTPKEDKIDVANYSQPKAQPIASRPIPPTPPHNHQVKAVPIYNDPAKVVPPQKSPEKLPQNHGPTVLPTLDNSKKQTLSTY